MKVVFVLRSAETYPLFIRFVQFHIEHFIPPTYLMKIIYLPTATCYTYLFSVINGKRQCCMKSLKDIGAFGKWFLNLRNPIDHVHCIFDEKYLFNHSDLYMLVRIMGSIVKQYKMYFRSFEIPSITSTTYFRHIRFSDLFSPIIHVYQYHLSGFQCNITIKPL